MDHKSNVTILGNTAWHAGNDGPDSGLDADLLDGNQATAFVLKADFNAYTVLAADTDNTPAALTVGASTIVGRKATGGIVALTASEGRTVLGLATTDSPTFDKLTVTDLNPTRMIHRAPGSTSAAGFAANVLSIGTAGNPTTGTLAILIPKVANATFMAVRITGYQYSTTVGRGAWSVLIGGYKYNASWLNTSTRISGASPFSQVRLGHKTVDTVVTHDAILLGAVGTDWRYPKILVEVQIYGGGSYTGYDVQWTHEFITDEALYTISATPPINIFEDATGKFGFGTVLPAEKLHVAAGNIQIDHQYKFRAHNSVGNDVDLAWVDSSNIAQYGTVGTNGWALGPASQSRILSGGASGSRHISFEAGGGTQAMRIDASGNLCLGADSSTAKLHVVGTIAVSAGIRPIADSTTAIQIKNAAGTEFVTFDSTNQRVGIGTDAPGVKLHIVSSALTGLSVDTTYISGSSNKYGAGITNTIANTAATTSLDGVGAVITAQHSAAYQIRSLMGLEIYAMDTSATDITTITGLTVNTIKYGDNTTVTAMYGIRISPDISSSPTDDVTATTLISLKLDALPQVAGVTITNKYAIIADDLSAKSGFGISAPTAIVHVKQNATTGGPAVLALEQLGNAEHFINFIATIATGNAINTDALGSYYGRVRVAVNGTYKWLALYN